MSFCAALFAKTVDFDAFTHIQIAPPVFELLSGGYSYVHVNGPNCFYSVRSLMVLEFLLF